MAKVEPPPARQRIVEAAGQMLRSRGYAEASLRDIVEAADAPWGSLQHYFPGGKQQLAIEAMTLGREQVIGFIDSAFARTRSAEGALRWFFDTSMRLLEESDYDFGCPVATVALERNGLADDVAGAAAGALEDWIDRFASGFRSDGFDARAARRLATAVVSQYEGALLVSRSARNLEAMKSAKTLMGLLLADAR